MCEAASHFTWLRSAFGSKYECFMRRAARGVAINFIHDNFLLNIELFSAVNEALVTEEQSSLDVNNVAI